MSADCQDILHRPFQTEVWKGRAIHQGGMEMELQVCEDGLHYKLGKEARHFLPIQDLAGWAFTEKQFIFEDATGRVCFFKSDAKSIDVVKKQFNILRARNYLDSLEAEDLQAQRLTSCPSCSLLCNISEAGKAPVRYCGECMAMFSDEAVLTQEGDFSLNFCPSGFFSLIGGNCGGRAPQVDENGRVLFTEFRPEFRRIFLRIAIHGVLSILWLGLLSLAWMAPSGLPQWLLYGIMGVLFFHVAAVGYYGSGLMMYGGARSYFFPKGAEKLGILCKKGRMEKAKKLMEDQSLHGDPGSWSNLAVGHFFKEEDEMAQTALRRALELCPNHPALINLAITILPKEEGPAWEARLEKVQRANQFEASPESKG